MTTNTIIIMILILICNPLSSDSVEDLDGDNWESFNKTYKEALMVGYTLGVMSLSAYLLGRKYASYEDVNSYDVNIMNPHRMLKEVDMFYKQTKYFDWPLWTVIPQRHWRPGKEYK